MRAIAKTAAFIMLIRGTKFAYLVP